MFGVAYRLYIVRSASWQQAFRLPQRTHLAHLGFACLAQLVAFYQSVSRREWSMCWRVKLYRQIPELNCIRRKRIAKLYYSLQASRQVIACKACKRCRPFFARLLAVLPGEAIPEQTS
jgi:hypothetical protein